MSRGILYTQNVAVIGAGVSGVSAAIHLKKAGLNVTVFERTRRVGGVWVFDERLPVESRFPSTIPSVGDTLDEHLAEVYKHAGQDQSHLKGEQAANALDLEIVHAPPGPAYMGLKNNISAVEMELSTQPWEWDSEEFVGQDRLAAYIESNARNNDVFENIRFGTRVVKVAKAEDGKAWIVDTVELVKDATRSTVNPRQDVFQAVVVAIGHYHAPNVPDIPGLAEWQAAYPNQVMHSKKYRHPHSFRDQNILIVGAGVSSTDIANETGPIARSVIQVSRGGQYDLPQNLLPPNASRVGPIKSFDALRWESAGAEQNDKHYMPIPGTVTLESGVVLCDIHRVIVATGYHVSVPFLRELHADGVDDADANETILVANGQQTHNLHKDIWYIPDPTLSFIGVPYHNATFSLFDFQAMALAAVLSGQATLPSEAGMRAEYNQRLAEKGTGRTFHSLGRDGDETAYVQDLVNLANNSRREGEAPIMTGHKERFLSAYARRQSRIRSLFRTSRSEEDEQCARAALPVCP